MKLLQRERIKAAVGVSLLAAYLLQALLGLEWTWLAERQVEQNFRRWTGVVLLIYLGHQWLLSLSRVMGWAKLAKKGYQHHKILGLAAPVVFYLHSIHLGYGYLLLLSTVYLANMLVGYVHPISLGIKPKLYAFPWMVAHVALSVLITVVVAYHIWFVFYYE
ncbi:MAG: hypothetical protein AAF604_14150 [Acidobacteriota bacterium]